MANCVGCNRNFHGPSWSPDFPFCEGCGGVQGLAAPVGGGSAGLSDDDAIAMALADSAECAEHDAIERGMLEAALTRWQISVSDRLGSVGGQIGAKCLHARVA